MNIGLKRPTNVRIPQFNNMTLIYLRHLLSQQYLYSFPCRSTILCSAYSFLLLTPEVGSDCQVDINSKTAAFASLT